MSLINLYKINKTFNEIFNEINTNNPDNMIGGDDDVSKEIKKINKKIDNIKNFSNEEREKLKTILVFFKIFKETVDKEGTVDKDNIYKIYEEKVKKVPLFILYNNESYLNLIRKFPSKMIKEYEPLLKISFIYLNDYSNNINKEESHEEESHEEESHEAESHEEDEEDE